MDHEAKKGILDGCIRDKSLFTHLNDHYRRLLLTELIFGLFVQFKFHMKRTESFELNVQQNFHASNDAVSRVFVR